MEEFEILDLEELSKQQGMEKAIKFLDHKIKKGYKVSVMVKKLFNFHLPPLQTKKNEVFSKQAKPITTESSQQEPNESSTSSYQSVPKQTMPATQNETPEHQDSASSDEQVSIYKVKNDAFEQALKNSVQQQKIQSALGFYQDGKLREALAKFLEIFNECWDLLMSGPSKINVFLAVQSLCYSAQVLRSLGQSPEAIKQLDKCVQLFEVNDFDLLGKIYMEKASNLFCLNQLLPALENYHKALQLYEQVNWKLDIARVLLKIAHIYALLNDTEDAKKICYEVLRIYQKKLEPTDQRLFETYFMLGCVYYYQKEHDFASEYLNMALEGYKKQSEKNINLVKIYNLLGIIQHQQGNSANAIEFYEQAVCLYGEETHIGLASLLNNLALAYLDKMKFRSSKLSFEKALTILKDFYPDNHRSVVRIQKNRDLVALATISYL
ncbi:hypothetical protein pb186bvf_017913 [Paramecium bursaria]